MLTANHNFILPDESLQKLIDHYWFINVANNVNNGDHYQIHLQSGCNEWFMCYNDSYNETYLGNNNIGYPKSIICGPRSLEKRLVFKNFSPDFKGVRIRFKPTGFFKLFGIPGDLLQNGIFLPEDVLGNQVLELHDQMESASNDASRVSILNRFFIKKLQIKKTYKISVERLGSAIDFIKSNAMSVKIGVLGEILNLSSRSLERDFNTILGLNPKEYTNEIMSILGISVFDKTSVKELLTESQINQIFKRTR